MGKDESSIEYVKDRPGHDRKYAIDSSKIKALGWKPIYTKDNFRQGLEETVKWYMDNKEWVENIEKNKKNEEENLKNDNPNMKFETEPKDENEKKIKELQEKINENKQELADREDRIKRLMAEFENFKKRSDKERNGMYSSVLGDIMTSILPIMDNLEKAAQTETKDEQYKSGIEMVVKQFQDVLTANGVKEIETVGKTFDPSLHEAVSSVVDENLGSKVIKEEYRKGYMIGDKVIRHSLVAVAN
jgi:molecular chaperone GrpE